jgi:hypothetical protein
VSHLDQLHQSAATYRDNHHWVPLRLNGKRPVGNDWQKRTLADPLPQFREGDNIGVLLGAPSGGIVRLDPDFPSIPAVTKALFPAPSMRFGRRSSPGSGRLMICDGIKTTNFRFPKIMKDDPRLPIHDGKPGVVVFQILSTGAQVMVPPSIHPESGEPVVWEVEQGLATLDQQTVIHRVGIEAFCMAARHFWPARGSRNEAAMAMARVLLEAIPDGSDEQRIALVDTLVLAVAMAGGDGEASRDGKCRAEATLEKMREGEHTTGMPRLIELLELPEQCAKTFRKWLGITATVSALDIQADEQVLSKVDELNKNHALVLAGDKAVVMKMENKTDFRLLKVSAFRQWHSNQHTLVGEKIVKIGDCWLDHPDRRQYEGIEFAPSGGRDGYYNLWQGFAIEPREGNCSKFLAHLRDNVAQGNEDHFNWIVGWWAQIVQQPTEKPGTSLVIRGKQGTGKTKIGEVFGSLFGKHYELVADPRYITGQFNSHMAALLVPHADEAFWAGDRRAEGKLKDLITGRKHRLEFKGIDPILVDNHIRLFITANHDWVVPAGFEERRNAVFDISEAKIRNTKYFAAIDEEMNNGGREALLHYLLTFDLSQINLRQIPRTEALFEQIVATATPEQSWWFDVLDNGTLPFGSSEQNVCPKKTLYNRYVKHASRQGARRKEIETKIGMFLKKYVGPELRSDEKKEYGIVDRHGHVSTENGRVYRFSALKDCRERFVRAIGQKVSWNEPEAEWQHEERNDDDEM